MSEVIETKLYKGSVKVRFFPESHIYTINGKRSKGVTTYIGIIDKSKPLISWAVNDCYKPYLEEALIGKKDLTEDDIFFAIEEGAKQHTVKKDQASDLGTTAHDWVENYIRSKIDKKHPYPDMPEEKEIIIAVNGFIDWVKKHKVKFVSTERIVYSKKYKFSGMMDIEAHVDGKLCLVDIKTSNGLYNTVRLQTAAYLMADVEENGKKYKGRWAVRLAKETEIGYMRRMKKKGRTSYPEYVPFEAKFLDEEPEDLERDWKGFLNAMKLFLWNDETDFYKLAKKKNGK